MSISLTSAERIGKVLSGQEPDRVPLLLLLTMHGAKELGLTLREYFSCPENLVEGQLRLRAKFNNDCIVNYYYGPIEIEAWGGEVIFSEDGPVNSGEPMIRHPEDILHLTPPDIRTNPILRRVLDSGELFRKKVTDAPVIGLVISPFSLPVMQMGFGPYLTLMEERPDLFDRLMTINEEHCVAWANAQFDAGVSAMCYFDPISSPSMVTPEYARRTGLAIARRVFSRLKGPAVIHFASGRCLDIMDDVAGTGAVGVGVSADEDLSILKKSAASRITLIGNMNAIQMRRWTLDETVETVKQTIRQGAVGGGFILSDNHGEIPYFVPDDVLHTIAETARTYGQYPIYPVE